MLSLVSPSYHSMVESAETPAAVHKIEAAVFIGTSSLVVTRPETDTRLELRRLFCDQKRIQ